MILVWKYSWLNAGLNFLQDNVFHFYITHLEYSVSGVHHYETPCIIV